MAIALLGIFAGGCDGERTAPAIVTVSGHTGTARASGLAVSAVPDPDGDRDNAGSGLYDRDDYAVLSFGHAAGQREQTAITRLVERYYAAAAVGNGGRACALVYSVLAEAISERERVASRAGKAAGACASVLSRLFASSHREWTRASQALRIVGVRVAGDAGFALLDFGVLRDRHIRLRREGSSWKIRELNDRGLA